MNSKPCIRRLAGAGSWHLLDFCYIGFSGTFSRLGPPGRVGIAGHQVSGIRSVPFQRSVRAWETACGAICRWLTVCRTGGVQRGRPVGRPTSLSSAAARAKPPHPLKSGSRLGVRPCLLKPRGVAHGSCCRLTSAIGSARRIDPPCVLNRVAHSWVRVAAAPCDRPKVPEARFAPAVGGLADPSPAG